MLLILMRKDRTGVVIYKKDPPRPDELGLPRQGPVGIDDDDEEIARGLVDILTGK